MDDGRVVATGGSAGGGVITALQMVLIILKITHTISWSWWIILMPTWLPLVGLVVTLVLVVIIAVIIAFFKEVKK